MRDILEENGELSDLRRLGLGREVGRRWGVQENSRSEPQPWLLARRSGVCAVL